MSQEIKISCIDVNVFWGSTLKTKYLQTYFDMNSCVGVGGNLTPEVRISNLDIPCIKP